MITKFNPFIFLLSTCIFDVVNFSLASAFTVPIQYYKSNILTFLMYQIVINDVFNFFKILKLLENFPTIFLQLNSGFITLNFGNKLQTILVLYPRMWSTLENTMLRSLCIPGSGYYK